MNLIRKTDYSEEDISRLVKKLYSKYRIEMIDMDVILKSSDVRANGTVSYWDSLVIASAIESGCNILYSEDMQHNQIIVGKLKIVNPFKKK